MQYAFDHPEASRDYVRAHAQELSDDVCAAHIALYVNTHSLDIGADGLRAIERLVSAGQPAADHVLIMSAPSSSPRRGCHPR